jgi:hypothetical protein
MNYDLANVNFEIELIRLIVEFLFGSIIDLNGNTDALGFRLVCKKFREEIDRLAHLSLDVPIRNYHDCLPSEISSISMFSSYEITKQDWENAFGDKLNNVESRLKHLHVDAYSIEYLPKFKCLKSILWKVDTGCYDLLKEIPHNDLIITGYITPFHGSIDHLTRLSEIEFTMGSSFDHKLVDKYLPSTILRMTINMFSGVADVIDLSKFRSLKYLKIKAHFGEQIIEELILPPSLYEFYSEAKIEKMNLYKCKNLGVLELKFK